MDGSGGGEGDEGIAQFPVTAVTLTLYLRDVQGLCVAAVRGGYFLDPAGEVVSGGTAVQLHPGGPGLPGHSHRCPLRVGRPVEEDERTGEHFAHNHPPTLRCSNALHSGAVHSQALLQSGAVHSQALLHSGAVHSQAPGLNKVYFLYNSSLTT